MDKSFRQINNCRLCNSNNLNKFIDFGNVPLGNNLQLNKLDAKEASSYVLDIMRCAECGHFQLGIAVNPEILYATNYTYLSGIGATFINHISEYAEWVKKNCLLAKNSFVVDIGSNDGTCLKAFQRLGHNVCGVDPASLPAAIANENGINTINSFFDSDVVTKIVNQFGYADFITSQNVLAHVDNLKDVFENIYKLLKKGGYFAFEIGYFREVLEVGCFDTIYHEHLDYHHATPLAKHLCSLGFDLLNLSVNSIQGGTLRLLFRKTGEGKIFKQARDFLNNEQKSILYNNEFLEGWRSKINETMNEFRRLIELETKKGAKIVAYGAPTKATLLMRMANINPSDIIFIVEDNPHKSDRFMPGTGIPIFPTSKLFDYKPDVIIILAWNFADDIITKLKHQLNYSPKLIIPLPKIKIVEL